jgi:branched-chain amino acid transport system ATP-binding protein
VLQVIDLEASYGEVKVLWGININVNSGEIVAIIGANGAGKSTFLNTCVGLHRADSGKIIFDGQEITSLGTHNVVKRGMTLVPEGRRVFPQLTVLENLNIASFGAANAVVAQEATELVFELFPRLTERRLQKAGTLSGGEQQMLAIARGIICQPKMLLLDEPSLGLAPVLIDHLFDRIQQINERGTAILLVEQNAYIAMEIAKRTYVLQNGRIVLEGLSEDLIQNDAIRGSYLGGTVDVIL